jgi:peptidoglycan/xylan/chitin deacetylase (PgdA/CDA1 family)
MGDLTQAKVALTFDDGPGRHTARLLEVLAAQDVRATFFLVGREVLAHPDLARAQAAAGHAIGNHSFTHPDLTTLDAAHLADEIDRTSDAIAAATGVRPTLARPPYGATDPAVAAALGERGLVEVLWDVDTGDWKGQDAATTARNALSGADDGAVILMHDTLEATVDAVPAIVDGLRERGFTFVTVPDLSGS